MGILENIKGVVAKTTKDVVKVSGTAVEFTKLKYKLGEVKDQIKNKYSQIGEIVYKSNVNEDVDKDRIENICDEITELLKKADEYETAINKTSNKKTCPSCGHVVTYDSVFCAKCGNMLD